MTHKPRTKLILLAGIAIVLVISFVGILEIKRILFQPRIMPYGLVMGNSLASLNHSQRSRLLSKIKALGFSEVRYNLAWSAVEPNSPDHSDWVASDLLVQDVQASGLKSVIILDRTPAWARLASCRDSDLCAPANPSDYAQFAAAVARRYKSSNVAAWEVWNEPNIVNFWKPVPEPNQYAKLLIATYTAIRQQDSSTPILIGGLSGNANDGSPGYMDGRTFLSRLYAAGAKNYFDGVAYHPYTSLRLPETTTAHNGWLKMYQTNPSIRGIMTANGDGAKDVWITEVGAPTNGPGGIVTDGTLTQVATGSDHVSTDLQAKIAEAALNDLRQLPWVKNFDWYTYQDSGSERGPAGSFYGLLQFNGQPKPAYYVFQRLLSSL